jgi:hypothetical protein
MAGRFVFILAAVLGLRSNIVVDDRGCIIADDGAVRLIDEELAEPIGGARRGRGLRLPRSTGAFARAAPIAGLRRFGVWIDIGQFVASL